MASTPSTIVKLLYDYTASDSKPFSSFNAGSMFILIHDNPDGWSTVHKLDSSKSYYLPTNYLEPVIDEVRDDGQQLYENKDDRGQDPGPSDQNSRVFVPVSSHFTTQQSEPGPLVNLAEPQPHFDAVFKQQDSSQARHRRQKSSDQAIVGATQNPQSSAPSDKHSGAKQQLMTAPLNKPGTSKTLPLGSSLPLGSRNPEEVQAQSTAVTPSAISKQAAGKQDSDLEFEFSYSLATGPSSAQAQLYPDATAISAAASGRTEPVRNATNDNSLYLDAASNQNAPATPAAVPVVSSQLQPKAPQRVGSEKLRIQPSSPPPQPPTQSPSNDSVALQSGAQITKGKGDSLARVKGTSSANSSILISGPQLVAQAVPKDFLYPNIQTLQTPNSGSEGELLPGPPPALPPKTPHHDRPDQHLDAQARPGSKKGDRRSIVRTQQELDLAEPETAQAQPSDAQGWLTLTRIKPNEKLSKKEVFTYFGRIIGDEWAFFKDESKAQVALNAYVTQSAGTPISEAARKSLQFQMSFRLKGAKLEFNPPDFSALSKKTCFVITGASGTKFLIQAAELKDKSGKLTSNKASDELRNWFYVLENAKRILENQPTVPFPGDKVSSSANGSAHEKEPGRLSTTAPLAGASKPAAAAPSKPPPPRPEKPAKDKKDTKDSSEKTSILTRLTNFFAKRPSQVEMKKRGLIRDLIFGSTIQKICDAEKITVPVFVTQCLLEVEKRGLDMDGIYRISGNLAQIQKLRHQVDQADHYSLDDLDIHVVTGTLRLFFRELQEPLIDQQCLTALYAAYSQADRDRVRRMRGELESLPKCHFDTLRALILHCKKVTGFSEKNRMHSYNLGTIFGPTLSAPLINAAVAQPMTASATGPSFAPVVSGTASGAHGDMTGAMYLGQVFQFLVDNADAFYNERDRSSF